jgi:hypothetical protein
MHALLQKNQRWYLFGYKEEKNIKIDEHFIFDKTLMVV